MVLTTNNRENFFADPQRRIAWETILYQQRIIRAFQTLRENDIEPILIKGWAIERFYPPDIKRQTADIDLSIAPKDYSQARRIIEQLNFPPDAIDLHCGMRHLDNLPWSDLFDNSRLIELHHVAIRVLRFEDNLRIACVHWLNDGGANREKLWDIFYLVKNRPTDFDWERCLDANGVKRRQWILCAIATAHRVLNLPIENMTFAHEIKSAVPVWFNLALEKEWNDPVKLMRLENLLDARDWRSLGKQIKKRVFPNPIAASIATEAAFDNSSRVPSQIINVGQRFIIHFRRNLQAVWNFLKYKNPRKISNIF